MPWIVADVEQHNKGLSDKQKEKWVSVANSSLAACKKKGEEDCEASAIKIANAAVSKTSEADAPNEPPSTCVCPECGHSQPKERGTPCRSLKCAECGGVMAAKVESDGEASEEEVSEVGKRLNAAQLTKLRTIREAVNSLLKWADYDDGEPPEEDVAELTEAASGHIINLSEAAPPTVVPLHLDIAIIEPGWGNKRDNHYYSAGMLRRDAGIFEGAKMYESDHRQAEKSTRTWVSTITDIVDFTDSGAPIARVSVHDRSFAERLLALNEDNLLSKMECSILASGKARKGRAEGKKGKIVEAITAADAVDWITRAGAGGRVLNIAEASLPYEEVIQEAYRHYEL